MNATATPPPALFDRCKPLRQWLPPGTPPAPGVHPGVQWLILRWLERAIEDAHWAMAGLIPPASPALEPHERHGPPPFAPDLLRRLALDALRRLIRTEARLAVEALEILILSRKAQPRISALLADHCARIEQVYLELQQRIGAGAALALLIWELRLLRHRGSQAAAPLAFGR